MPGELLEYTMASDLFLKIGEKGRSLWPPYLILPCIVIFLAISPTHSQVKLPRLISDGMVLQRDQPINIWGWASGGESIKIQFGGKNYSTLSGTDGKWSLKLLPMKAGGPYIMDITALNHIIIKDILIGDVWICSGQSNMEFRMEQVKVKYRDAVAQSSNNQIRQFLVDQQYNFQSPGQDLSSTGWKSANPENVLQFTAVGYFFARSLYQKYHVPIGLIHSSKGGSPAEAWLSEEALKAFPDYYNMLPELKDSLKIKTIAHNDSRLIKEWFDQVNDQDSGMLDANDPWFANEHSTAGWNEANIPGFWKEQGVPEVNGIVWFRKEVDVPASMTGKEVILYLGNIADDDITYVNGIRVGSNKSRHPSRVYVLDPGILNPGKNTITVRVTDRSGQAGFIKDKPYKLALLTGQSVSLEGTWKYKQGSSIPNRYLPGTPFDFKPGGLYNAMIAPLLNYGIKGVIWYQGEANTSRAAEYRRLFPALIADWRKQWRQGEFPFLYVQLASFLPAVKQPSPSEWAELREAQLMALSVPNTGMAVIADIGAWNDVHPSNKEDVGKRLALAARKIAYHEKGLVYSGPRYESKQVSGNKIILSFSNCGSGLTTKNGQPLQYFSIAAKDGRFVWAKAIIKDNKVIVWSDAVNDPVAVRYGWADNPDGANLFNREGLPASPFRTDTGQK